MEHGDTEDATFRPKPYEAITVWIHCIPYFFCSRSVNRIVYSVIGESVVDEIEWFIEWEEVGEIVPNVT